MMQDFSFYDPSPLLRPYVKYYWILKDNGKKGSIAQRVIPTGCLQLIFHRKERLFSSGEKVLQPRAFLGGQMIGYDDLVFTGTIDMVVVVFNPQGAGPFFPVPLSELSGKTVPIAEISQEMALLENRVLDVREDLEAIRLIESFLLKTLVSSQNYHTARVTATIHAINLNPHLTLDELSEMACLSPKQYGRVFTGQTGFKPKEFARIVRLQRALYLLQQYPHITLSRLTYECGFYDQAHMVREFKAISGYTPKEYLSVCEPYSDYFSGKKE